MATTHGIQSNASNNNQLNINTSTRQQDLQKLQNKINNNNSNTQSEHVVLSTEEYKLLLNLANQNLNSNSNVEINKNPIPSNVEQSMQLEKQKNASEFRTPPPRVVHSKNNENENVHTSDTQPDQSGLNNSENISNVRLGKSQIRQTTPVLPAPFSVSNKPDFSEYHELPNLANYGRVYTGPDAAIQGMSGSEIARQVLAFAQYEKAKTQTQQQTQLTNPTSQSKSTNSGVSSSNSSIQNSKSVQQNQDFQTNEKSGKSEIDNASESEIEQQHNEGKMDSVTRTQVDTNLTVTSSRLQDMSQDVVTTQLTDDLHEPPRKRAKTFHGQNRESERSQNTDHNEQKRTHGTQNTGDTQIAETSSKNDNEDSDQNQNSENRGEQNEQNEQNEDQQNSSQQQPPQQNAGNGHDPNDGDDDGNDDNDDDDNNDDNGGDNHNGHDPGNGNEDDNQNDDGNQSHHSEADSKTSEITKTTSFMNADQVRGHLHDVYTTIDSNTMMVNQVSSILSESLQRSDQVMQQNSKILATLTEMLQNKDNVELQSKISYKKEAIKKGLNAKLNFDKKFSGAGQNRKIETLKWWDAFMKWVIDAKLNTKYLFETAIHTGASCFTGKLKSDYDNRRKEYEKWNSLIQFKHWYFEVNRINGVLPQIYRRLGKYSYKGNDWRNISHDYIKLMELYNLATEHATQIEISSHHYTQAAHAWNVYRGLPSSMKSRLQNYLKFSGKTKLELTCIDDLTNYGELFIQQDQSLNMMGGNTNETTKPTTPHTFGTQVGAIQSNPRYRTKRRTNRYGNKYGKGNKRGQKRKKRKREIKSETNDSTPNFTTNSRKFQLTDRQLRLAKKFGVTNEKARKKYKLKPLDFNKLRFGQVKDIYFDGICRKCSKGGHKAFQCKFLVEVRGRLYRDLVKKYKRDHKGSNVNATQQIDQKPNINTNQQSKQSNKKGGKSSSGTKDNKSTVATIQMSNKEKLELLEIKREEQRKKIADKIKQLTRNSHNS